MESKNRGQQKEWRNLLTLHGYRKNTLTSDTESAIIAFRNRAAEVCEAEVTTENAVKGDKESDKESNGLIENAVMLTRGIIRTIKCHIESSTEEPLSDESLILPWLVEHAGCILSRCEKGLHGKKPTEELLATQLSTDPMNRMNPRYKFGMWLGMRNNNASCFIGNADGVFRAREIRRLES